MRRYPISIRSRCRPNRKSTIQSPSFPFRPLFGLPQLALQRRQALPFGRLGFLHPGFLHEVDHALLADMGRQHGLDDAPPILDRFNSDTDLFNGGLRKKPCGFQIYGPDQLEGDGNDHFQPIDQFPVPMIVGHREFPNDDDLSPYRLGVPTPKGRQRLKRHRIELSALLIELKILLHYLSRRVAGAARLGPRGISLHARQQRQQGHGRQDRRNSDAHGPARRHEAKRSGLRRLFTERVGKNHRDTVPHSTKGVPRKHVAPWGSSRGVDLFSDCMLRFSRLSATVDEPAMWMDMSCRVMNWLLVLSTCGILWAVASSAGPPESRAHAVELLAGETEASAPALPERQISGPRTAIE